MAKGDRCRARQCDNIQPCPNHTALGHPRRNSVRKDHPVHEDNVHELFTEAKQADGNEMRPRGGKKPEEGDKRPQRWVKQRLGRRWSQIHDEVAQCMYTWNDFVEQLDAEELARAQLKADDGTFRGRPPEFVPRAFYLACQREMVQRFNQTMQSNLQKATEELIKIGMDEGVDANHRAKVLQYVIERVVGKIPDKVEVKAADPWETIIGDILAEAPAGVGVPAYMESRTANDD